MANREPAGFLTTSGGSVINAYTDTATFQTQAHNAGYDWIGLYFNVTALSGGSTPTVRVSLEASPDAGTTWVAFSEDKNSNTQATLADFTATGTEFQYWLNPFPAGAGWTWRAVITEVNTWGTTTMTGKFFQRNTASETGV